MPFDLLTVADWLDTVASICPKIGAAIHVSDKTEIELAKLEVQRTWDRSVDSRLFDVSQIGYLRRNKATRTYLSGLVD